MTYIIIFVEIERGLDNSLQSN